MEELHGNTVKNAIVYTTDLLKSSVDTADIVNIGGITNNQNINSP